MKTPDECSTIQEVRGAIDEIDNQIIEALALRFQYVKAVTRYKKTKEDVLANDRYNAVIEARREWAAASGLDPDVIEEMYRTLIGHFIDEEMKDLGLVDTGQQ